MNRIRTNKVLAEAKTFLCFFPDVVERKGLSKAKKWAKKFFKNEMRWMEDDLARKDDLRKYIDSRTEDNQVAIMMSGIDCDGVEWSNAPSIMENPSVYKIWKFEREYYEYADGSKNWGLCKPSTVVGVRSTSRDLATEAFENGHPHVLYT